MIAVWFKLRQFALEEVAMKKASCLMLVGALFIIATALPAGAQWEGKWNDILAAAKKEGKVSVYHGWGPLVVQSVSEAFPKKYGIEIEWAAGRGTDVVEKMRTEKTAGLKAVDVLGAGSTTLLVSARPQGLLASMEQFLMLPEVLDTKVWMGNKLPFIDKQKTAMALSARITNHILVNADMIKPGEILSVRDLLKPQYKGKVTVDDPSTSGAGNAVLGSLGYHAWKSSDEALKFLKDLLANDAAITRDKRQHVEWVARGKYPIAFGANADPIAAFLEAGAKLEALVTKEATNVTAGAGAIGVSSDPAHPNATIVFLNWLLSKEGQTAFMRGTHQPITRTDVALEGIHPIFTPNPKQEVYVEDEEFIRYRETLMEPAAKIIAEASK
jgi:iron(III) transport system substrate-binding protein